MTIRSGWEGSACVKHVVHLQPAHQPLPQLGLEQVRSLGYRAVALCNPAACCTKLMDDRERFPTRNN